MAQLRPLLTAAALLSAATFGAACQPPPAEANVLVAFPEDSTVRGFVSPRAELTVIDAQDRAVTVHTFDELGDAYRVQTPMEVPCTATSCGARVTVPPGDYRFELVLSVVDRCGERGPVVRLTSQQQSFLPNSGVDVDLAQPDWSFDDDDDGIENALELNVCGRFYVPDTDRPPTECVDAADPCCAPASDLIGRASRFDGGSHTLADGSVVTVEPFHLDATEATWGGFARCVAAGACLSGKPEHAVREQLLDPTTDRTMPVTGLTPDEADDYCTWRGRRLPTDVEWDFAAAHRADGGRGRWPWDTAGLGATLDAPAGEEHAPPTAPVIGCLPDEPYAANHRAPGRGCPRLPRAVGSYGDTFVHRGVGAPLADMGGNAWEWTRDEREGTAALRGGGWDSVPQLLENDLRLTVGTDDDIERLKEIAGFRCARALMAGEDALATDAALQPLAEPACVPE